MIAARAGVPSPTPWKAIGWSIAFLASGLVLTLAVLAPLAALFPVSLDDPLQAAMVQTVAMLIGFGVATWLVGVRGARLTGRDLRWIPVRAGANGFGRGLLIGILPGLAALILGVLAGSARWSLDGGSFTAWLGVVTGLGAVLLPAALAEEVVFRGVALVLLAAVAGRWVAGTALALLFALAHLANPDIGAIGLGNIALAGVFLTGCFYLPGGIWTATGAHLGWNLSLAALAAPVSGLPFGVPLLDFDPGGPAWFTGGAFGPEGGVAATLVLAVATVLVIRTVSKERVA